MAWNRPSEVGATSPSRQNKARTRHLRGLFAAAVVIVGAAVAWWIFSLNADEARTRGRKSRAVIADVGKSGKEHSAPKRREVAKTGDRLRDALAEIEASGELVKIAAPPKKPELTNSRTNRFYKNGIEQLLNWVAATEPGDMPMPIPLIDKDDRANLVNILSIPCPITKDDSEDLKALKEAVNYGKKEMAGYVADGGDPDQFFDYYFEQLKQAYEMHCEVQTAYHRLIRENPDLASEFRVKANETLAQKGIKPIEPNRHLEPEEYAKLHPDEPEPEVKKEN